jgi:hypothetical protein
VKKRKNNGRRRRLTREEMLTRDLHIWAMKQRRMTPTEIGYELGMARQTVDRSLERSTKLHANDDPLQNLRECLANEGTGEPEDDPNLTLKQNAKVWDKWAAGLTVADVERIARTPHPELLLWRLRKHDLPPDAMDAVNVAWQAHKDRVDAEHDDDDDDDDW